MRRKGRPKKQKSSKVIKGPGKRGRPKSKEISESGEPPQKKAKRGRPKTIKVEKQDGYDGEDLLELSQSHSSSAVERGVAPDENYSEGLHMSTMQVRALSSLVACLDCGEGVVLGVRPTTKGMISEFTVSCKVCGSNKSTNTPNLIRERKRKREKKGVVLQKNENINYAHVAAYLDNGLGYSGLRHYCKYLNARCLNEATFIVYAKQVISDVVTETEDFLQQNARIVRKAFESQLDTDYIFDLTVGYTTTYHQWGSDFCLVAGAVIELQTGLVLDYDVGNMYCHVCKINAKKIVSMSPSEMTEWFNKHQDTCEIREWCDEIDQDSEEGIKEIDPKYLEAFIAKKIWSRSLEKFGFRYTTLIHESDERIHSELLKAAPYGDIPVIIDNITNCFSRRKSEHARTSFQNKLKSKCPRERVQTKDRIMYVYAMSIPEYNKFAIGSNIKLRELVRQMEIEEEEYADELSLQAAEIIPAIQQQEMMEVKEMVMKDVGDAFEVERDEEELEEPEEMDEEMEEIISSEDIEVLEEGEEEYDGEHEKIPEKNTSPENDGEKSVSSDNVPSKSKDSEKTMVKGVINPPVKKNKSDSGEKTVIAPSDKSSNPSDKVTGTPKTKAAADGKVSDKKVVSTEGTTAKAPVSAIVSKSSEGNQENAANATTAKSDLQVKKTDPQTKPTEGTTSGIKNASMPSHDSKVATVEKKVVSEKKEEQKGVVGLKSAQKQAEDVDESNKSKEVKQNLAPSENGMEESKGSKQPDDVRKPFRVEFDED